MKKYFSRVAGYFLRLLIIIVIILLPVTYILQGGNLENMKDDLLRGGRLRLFLIILIVYLFIYPLILYGKKERYINGSFKDNRDGFIRAFEEQNYVLTKERDTILEFRKKSGYRRIISLAQDKVEVDYSGNPVIIEGLRNELSRIDKSLDMILLKED